jgi:hypothetical protein
MKALNEMFLEVYRGLKSNLSGYSLEDMKVIKPLMRIAMDFSDCLNALESREKAA